MGFGACGAGPSGVFWVGAQYKNIKEYPWEKDSVIHVIYWMNSVEESLENAKKSGLPLTNLSTIFRNSAADTEKTVSGKMESRKVQRKNHL